LVLTHLAEPMSPTASPPSLVIAHSGATPETDRQMGRLCSRGLGLRL